jgi:hypothetical protein
LAFREIPCPGRSAACISAFTRVFDALWLLRRAGTHSRNAWAPDQQRTTPPKSGALRSIRGTEQKAQSGRAISNMASGLISK